jgi:hypothetical protein
VREIVVSIVGRERLMRTDGPAELVVEVHQADGTFDDHAPILPLARSFRCCSRVLQVFEQ